MKRNMLIFLTSVAVAGLGCSNRIGPELEKKINEKLSKIEKRLSRIEGERGRDRRKPDPMATYAVPIAGSPFKGPKNAKVTMVEAFEFASPHCMTIGQTVKQLLEQYEGDLKVVYKHYVVHPQHATIPAQAACAADKQGRFFEIEPLIWEKGFKTRDLGKGKMMALAREIGLEMTRFEADMAQCKQVIQRDRTHFSRFGVSATPGFFINGRFLGGAVPIAHFKKLIDVELKKANAVIAKGDATVENYYRKVVLGKGKKKL